MASNRFDCGGYYKKYDMSGEIQIGTGVVKVHDIFKPVPEFMKEADVIFCDPPYNQSALSSFYTKADMRDDKPKFIDLFDRFFEVVDEINPRLLILEVGVPQEGLYLDKLAPLYKHVKVSRAKYYNREECLIIVASNEHIPDFLSSLPNIDEERIIDMICKELDYECICDPMMGTGLVGWYSNKYGKKFVGTELNKKRLAILVESITTGRKECR